MFIDDFFTNHRQIIYKKSKNVKKIYENYNE